MSPILAHEEEYAREIIVTKTKGVHRLRPCGNMAGELTAITRKGVKGRAVRGSAVPLEEVESPMFTKCPAPNAIKDTVNPQTTPGYGCKGRLPAALTSCHLRCTGVRRRAQRCPYSLIQVQGQLWQGHGDHPCLKRGG